MAYVDIGRITDTSIRARLAGLNKYDYTDRKIHWYLDGDEYGNQNLGKTAEDDGTSSWYTFSGLEPNTTYDIYAIVEFTRSGFEGVMIDIYTENGYMPTTDPPPIPQFDWTYANADKNGKPNKSTNGEKAAGYFYMSADEWNELVDITQMRISKAYPNANYHLDEARATRGHPFTAEQFNIVRKAIGAHHSTGITKDKIRGDIIYYAELNKLRECVNLP